MKIYPFIIPVFISCLILALSGSSLAKSEDYGINDLAKVEMSYDSGGGKFGEYAQVKIQGDGKATCTFRVYNQPEHKEELRLEKSFIEDFVKQYASLNFFDYDFNKITDSSDEKHRIYDATTTVLTYKYGDMARSIDYEIVKTKTRGDLAVPVNEDAEKLVQLQRMYWKIISHEMYKAKLKDYQKMDKGSLANELSSLTALAERKEILNPKELVPIIMEIISQKEYRDSIGQYAARALEAITAEKLPGDWWDCEKWLKWWEANKAQYENN